MLGRPGRAGISLTSLTARSPDGDKKNRMGAHKLNSKSHVSEIKRIASENAGASKTEFVEQKLAGWF